MDARVRGAILFAAVTLPGGALAQPAGTTTKQAPTETSQPADDAAADGASDGEGVTREPDPAPGGPSTEGRPAEAAGTASAEIAKAPAFTWEPFGYLRIQYVVSQNDPNVAFVGRDDGYELQNARLGVRGALDDRASFVVSFDGAVDERTQINVPEGKLRVGLRDAYADVAISGKVVGRGGFFQSVIDPESRVADTQRAFVDKPIESRGIRPNEGYQTQGLTPGRSLGAAIRMDPAVAGGSPIGFEIAVQNGADEFASNNDNDKPAVSAALLAQFPAQPETGATPGAVTALVVGARYNPRTAGELPFRQDENDLQASAGLQFAAGQLALGVGGVFVRTTFPTTGGPVQNSYGGHAQLMVRAGTALPFAFGYRFGILDPSSLILTDRVMEHTAGAVLGVPRYRMRLQFQVTHVMEQRTLSNSRGHLAAEVSF
ncbi:MAG: hypothetical protein H0X17_00765 [Deltaproteobacteria bacterium]|nr:hypothetical protein [Deltaproteobacteria bacterium]